jgi:hypothetical protein
VDFYHGGAIFAEERVVSKPLIFISHIHEDSGFAELVRRELDTALLGAAQFFSSSDRTSIEPGDPWREKILDALTRSDVVLVVASPRSVAAPWIHFESGGGWVGGSKVIPVCVGGMVPSSLPRPLSDLQALDLSTSDGIECLFTAIASVAELRAPADLDSLTIANKVQTASRADQSNDQHFVQWVNRAVLRPGKHQGESASGRARVREHIYAVDQSQATQLKNVRLGESIQASVDIAGAGTLYYCFATGEIADRLLGLVEKQHDPKKRSVTVTLECLGYLKEYDGVNRGFDSEDKVKSTKPAFMIAGIGLRRENDLRL